MADDGLRVTSGDLAGGASLLPGCASVSLLPSTSRALDSQESQQSDGGGPVGLPPATCTPENQTVPNYSFWKL